MLRVRGVLSTVNPETPGYGLARWTGEAGDPAAARDLYAELLPVRARILGPEALPTPCYPVRTGALDGRGR